MAKPDAALLDPARYPFVHEVTTRFADMDPNQHLNNVAIAALFEDGRVRFAHATGSRGAMVASVGIEYLDQAFYPDPVTSYVALERVGRTSWTTVQVLLQNGKVFAFARTVAVCTPDGRPAVIDDALRAELSRLALRNA